MLKQGLKLEVMRLRARAIGYRIRRNVVQDGTPYRYGIFSDSGAQIAAYNCRASVWIHLKMLSAEQRQPLP